MFDGRKNLYSRDPLPIGRDKVKVAMCVTEMNNVVLYCILSSLLKIVNSKHANDLYLYIYSEL